MLFHQAMRGSTVQSTQILTPYQAFDEEELFDEGEGEEEEEKEERHLTSSQMDELIAKHASQSVEEFNNRVTELGKKLDVDFGKLRDRLLKSVEDVKADLKSTYERLSKEVNDVYSKAVESAKERVDAAVSKQIGDFAQVHLKDHVKVFLGDLLKLENIASYSDIEATNIALKAVEDSRSQGADISSYLICINCLCLRSCYSG